MVKWVVLSVGYINYNEVNKGKHLGNEVLYKYQITILYKNKLPGG